MDKIDGVKAGGAQGLQEWNEPVLELQESEQSPQGSDDPQMGKQVEKVFKEFLRPVQSKGGTRMEEPLKPQSVKRDLMPPTGGSNTHKPQQHGSGSNRTPNSNPPTA
jgi:hypothetical protein